MDTFWIRWVRNSTLGWLFGLVVVIGLAVLGDIVTSGGGESQLIVGVGIGLGVGLGQGRLLRAWLGRSTGWAISSVVGMGALFIVHDLATATGYAFPFSLPPYVLLGGLVTGLWEALLLRRVSARAPWWPVISTLGWGVPALFLALADAMPGMWGQLASMSVIFLGGAMLGAVSGAPLKWILGRAAV